MQPRCDKCNKFISKTKPHQCKKGKGVGSSSQKNISQVIPEVAEEKFDDIVEEEAKPDEPEEEHIDINPVVAPAITERQKENPEFKIEMARQLLEIHPEFRTLNTHLDVYDNINDSLRDLYVRHRLKKLEKHTTRERKENDLSRISEQIANLRRGQISTSKKVIREFDKLNGYSLLGMGLRKRRH